LKIACAQSVIKIEVEALNALSANLDSNFAEAIELMSDAQQQNHKIIICGVGKSGNISYKIAATMNSTGDLGLISDGDVVLALSYSGETRELLELIPYIKRFNVKIVCITGCIDSSLSHYSDVTLHTPVEREACPLNLAPTSSSTAALVMGDALAMVLLKARGFTEKDFAKYHPGGSLGKAMLTTVSDIMRKDTELASLGHSASVDDAITAMSKSRAGACVIVDEAGSLTGVFTHGDFARAFNEHENVRGMLVTDFMTKNPITVQASSLAWMT